MRFKKIISSQRKELCSCISCNGNPPQQCCIHFSNEMVMLFTIEPTCNCEIIRNHVTCYLKNPGRSPGALCSNHTHTIPNQLCSLFIVCFHLFQPATVSIGADIRGAEGKRVVSSPPFFVASAGTI